MEVSEVSSEVLDVYMAAGATLYEEVLKRKGTATAGAAPRAAVTRPTPGVLAASMYAARGEAVTARTGAGAVGLAAGGLEQHRPRKRKLREVAPW